MPSGARIEGELQFPVPLYCAREVLGTELPIRVAGRDGTVACPVLTESAAKVPHYPRDVFARLKRPPGATPRVPSAESQMHAAERVTEWGEPRQWPTLNSMVKAVGIWFPLQVHESETHQALTISEPILAAIPEWVNRLTTGLEVLTRQVLDSASFASLSAHDTELYLTMAPARRMPLPPNVISVNVTMPDAKSVVTLDSWVRAVSAASASSSPRLEHLLLRDARHALRRSEYRRAVIDAGTAAEIALTEILSEKLGVTLGKDAGRVVFGRFRMLGNLVNLAQSLKLSLGTQDLSIDLLEPRNRAAHRGEALSHLEALAALRAATNVVDALVPERFQA